ncbi:MULTISPECIES: IS5 family transposase [Paenarthrobacter]|uniref:IS5 family transposase n=1 Tax=Paenarthrobacter TaxID=1742992 RepID=UPI000FEC3A4D|nr:IS5 family transposase [Paenarthrobacter ureafaciens]RWW94287.1 IS5 family transposase [Paenarthrobacter ureafaciens]
MSRFQVFTDDQWARVEPLLPSSDGQRGRPFRNHRQVVEGIAYRYRCGIAWRDLPEQFGPWQTVWKRHRRFAADGIWDRIHSVLLTEADADGEIDWTVSVDSTINRAHQHGTNLPRNTGGSANYKKLSAEPEDHAVGRSRGGLSTKIHHACDGKGRPLAFIIGPGQGSDSRVFPHVIDAINVPRAGTGRARTRPDTVMGDKAYSSRANRSLLRARKIKAVIPEPRDQIANRKRKGARGGRPVDFDSEAYKGRSVVEQSFNIFKQWRSIATRYDKLAITYRSGVALYSVLIWLRQ